MAHKPEQRSSSAISHKQEVVITLLALVLNVVAFMPMLSRMHFSVDSYHLIANQNAFWYLQNGRYTWWLITMLTDKLGLNLVLNQRIFMVLAVLAFSASVAMLTMTFSRLSGIEGFKRRCSLVLVLSLVWINVFVMEFILFPESAVSAAFGSLFVTLAAVLTLRKPTVWSVLGSVMSLLVALGCYQSLVGYYLAFVLIGWCLDRNRGVAAKARMRTVARWALALAIAAFGSLFNVVIVKFLIRIGYIVDPGRGAKLNIRTMLGNIATVIAYQPSMLNNADGLLPKFSVTLLVVGLVALAVVSAMKWKNLPYLQLVCAVVVSYIAAFAPHYIEQNVLLTPRSNMAVWAVFGATAAVLVVSVFRRYPDGTEGELAVDTAGHQPADGAGGADGEVVRARQANSRTGKIATMSVTVVALLAVIGSCLSLSDMAYDTFISNVQDRDYAAQVIDRIHEYERESHQEVTSIAITPDTNVNVKYGSVRYQNHELNRRIMNTQYSNFEMLNYLGGMNLTKIDMPASVYEAHFEGKNWNGIDLDEQLVFSGHDAYLALY